MMHFNSAHFMSSLPLHLNILYWAAFQVLKILHIGRKFPIQKEQHPTAHNISDVFKSRMERHTCMRCRPVGESDASQFWQDSLETAFGQRTTSQKHMRGICASHLIQRSLLIRLCWEAAGVSSKSSCLHCSDSSTKFGS